MKKIILTICLFLLVACNKKELVNIRTLKSFDEFKYLNKEDIVNIKRVKFTEGGDNTENYTNKEDINRIFNNISSIKLGEETQMSCEDNTTVYVFNMKDETSISVEIECDWIIIGNKRYLIVK